MNSNDLQNKIRHQENELKILQEKLRQKEDQLSTAKKDLASLVDLFNSQVNFNGSKLVKIGAFSYHLISNETQSLHTSAENVSFDTASNLERSISNNSINYTDF